MQHARKRFVSVLSGLTLVTGSGVAVAPIFSMPFSGAVRPG